MVKISVSELKPGMKLANDVYLEDGRLLLIAGITINNRYIARLESFNIPYVLVNEKPETEEEPVEEKIYSEALNSLKSVISSIRESNQFNPDPLKESVKNIVHQVMNNECVLMHLTGIRDIDNYTFNHSIDVCIYSVITAKYLGFSIKEMNDLGVGAILHDIGKCKIPRGILMKPAKLTDEEYETIKKHTVYGYEILSNTYGLSTSSAAIALSHHEKWDGSGYPRKLSGFGIDMFSRIVAVADIYDSLTADRVYRKRLLPHQAAEYLLSSSSTQLDPEIVSAFVKSIAIYPDNTILLLDNGEIGIVVDSVNTSSIHPRVRIIARKDGPPVLKPYIRDLSTDNNVSIANILSK